MCKAMFNINFIEVEKVHVRIKENIAGDIER